MSKISKVMEAGVVLSIISTPRTDMSTPLKVIFRYSIYRNDYDSFTKNIVNRLGYLPVLVFIDFAGFTVFTTTSKST